MTVRWIALPGMALAAVVALSGCAKTVDQPTVATAGGTATAGPSGGAVTTYVEAVRTYVACLRGEGVRVSDPDPQGKIEFEGDLGALKKDSSFLAAQTKCKSLLPPVPEGLQDKPVKSVAEIEVVRRYAECMRANGAPDFPDPGPDGYFPQRGPDGSAAWDQTSEGARRASQACASIIGDPSTPGPGVG